MASHNQLSHRFEPKTVAAISVSY